MVEDNMEESNTEALWSMSLLRVRHLPTSSQEHHLPAFVCKALAPNDLSSLSCIWGWFGRLKLVTEPIVKPWEGRTRPWKKIEVYVPYMRVLPSLGNKSKTVGGFS